MRLGIRPGHIPDCPRRKPRRNKHTGLDEDFDPNQIFLSPAIKYSSNQIYASLMVPIPPPLNHAENGTIMIGHDQIHNLSPLCRSQNRILTGSAC